MRAEDGGIIGDGIAILSPGDPGFDEWDRWLARQESGEPD
jgi:precorrin-6B methylase 1